MTQLARAWTRFTTWFLNLAPHWKLFILAPVMAELVSHHQPLWEFFNPIIIGITFIPYGCGALVARELVVRNGKGWASLILLGAAFSLVFEGIVTRVMFNPMWDELGALATYQHVYAFNWSLSIGLVHFHIALSIFAAVALTEMFHPERRHESWISDRALLWCAVAVPAWTVVIGLFVSFMPPLTGLIALIALVIALIVLALHIPAHPFADRGQSAPRPWVFGMIGGLMTTGVMVSVYMLPEMTTPPPLLPFCIVLGALLVIAWTCLVYASGGGARWTDQHRLALVAGLLAFFIA
ncbi:MAG: hypothetical protein JXA10_17445, partial [Anaerolineae bacterium]|nr:hypothetical protein [Anaerolineae bacterium]